MLKTIVEDGTGQWGQIFQRTIQILIIISLVAFAVETLPSLSSTARRWLHYLEIATVMIFTVEYGLRLWAAERKLAFVISFYGLVDLLAILPFYISLGIDLRSIRAFRLLRLFRALKLARYSKAVQRFHTAFLISKEEIILFFSASILLLYLAAVGIYHFEHAAQPDTFSSVFAGLWWAVATLTSVGYGDIYPITVGGKLFTFFILLIGIGMVSVPSGLIASAFAQARILESEPSEQEPLEEESE